MNKITLDELNNITNILIQNNLDKDTVFDYFRIVSISKEKIEEKANNPLYFIIYTKEEELKNGWYNKKFDLRPYMNNIMQDHPNYTFVIDKTMIKDLKVNGKFIVVEDIHKTIDDLFNYFKDKSNAKTIAVTGSVGKTTLVGLIESILKNKYNTLRIYSKRITPLILKANIINYLNDDIDYIVTENSIYYSNQVKILAELLKPEIGVILNIESSHLGIDNLKTLDDICKYKSFIMNFAKKGYIIKDDIYLDKLHIDNGTLKYDDESILINKDLQLNKIDMSKIKIENEMFNINDEIIVNPFILSNLSKRQYIISYMIGKELGLTAEEIKKGMETYKPVENRLHIESAFGKKIILDGDITTYERMKELSDNMYKDKYLVLRKVGSAENTFRISDIKKHFSKYKKVFIFNDIDYFDELKDGENIQIVYDHSFMVDLEGTIIYHYSGYYRVWDTFDENNLKEYDKVKYPILKG